MNFDVGVELCRKHGLPELEKRLYSSKRTLERPVLEAELSHVGPWSPTRKESIQPRGIVNRDQQPASSAEPITDGSIQAEVARKTDSGSDGAGSRVSVSSREPRSIGPNPQPVPSIRDAGDATPSRQSGRDIRYSLLELADPHLHSAKSAQYEVWDSRSQLSGRTEVKPNLKPSTYNTFSHYGSFDELFAST